uniref:Inositol polyphosphate-related phosphatase domain-containing protein n=1 Tax=Glossina brevipalpis TaxID=37001 RepID=A0A1A9WWZ9_9MUSC
MQYDKSEKTNVIDHREDEKNEMEANNMSDHILPSQTNTDTKHSDIDSSCRVYVITWNVGSRFPDNISLRNLLGLNTTDHQHMADIYAIGLQEVNVQPQQQVLGLFKEDPWTAKVKGALGDLGYVVFKTEQMQGLLLTMLIKRIHVHHLRNIEAEYTRTGFGGIWGNKGAVSIRFNLYGCDMTFVNAHLAAHDSHLEERIQDFKQIMDNHHYHVKRFRGIYDHDYVFWFGDLNFRLSGEDTSKEVEEAIICNSFDELITRDQLSYVREVTREAFHLLHERKPTFPPTFKFKEGTCEYDLKRRPAWTDRILYGIQPDNCKPNTHLHVNQFTYKSHPDYSISDHKPVTGEFSIKLFPSDKIPIIHFSDLYVWRIGEENTVEYTKPVTFKECEHDWIGVYQCEYTSLRDYVAYEYVCQAESPPPSPDLTTDPFFTHAPRRLSQRHRNPNYLRRQMRDNDEIVRLDFADDIELKSGEQYVLIYFQNSGLRGVTSVYGISNVFRAEMAGSSSLIPNVD